MSELISWSLASMQSYGVPMLLLIAFIGSLGIPFPITPVIIAAGALAHQGFFDWRLAALACLAGASLADHSEYLLGRHAGRWIRKRFGKDDLWLQANSTINRQGGWAILLTRFWLTSLAPVINLIAGSRFPYPRFLFFDLTGQVLWVLLYGGLGFFFASQWEQVSLLVGKFSALTMVLFALFLLIYLLLKGYRRAKARRDVQRDWPSK